MNERIFKLALEAMNFQGAIDTDTELKLSNDELEKFAELIVRECMKVTKDYTCNQGWDYSAPVALARHFGVGS